MKIEFPKIVGGFSLSDYAPEMQGAIQVWVNPPRNKLLELYATYKQYLEERKDENLSTYMEIVSELLSQGTDKWTAAELQELHDGTQETDPAFWLWMQNRILETIMEHQTGQKKT